jgi:hypothetical protein
MVAPGRRRSTSFRSSSGTPGCRLPGSALRRRAAFPANARPICRSRAIHKLLARSLPGHRRTTAWDDTWEPWLIWRVGCGTGRRRWWSGFQDARPLDHAREIRDRLFVEGGRLSLSRLPDFRQVAAGQDRQEARCHPPIKAVPAAAGKSFYRLGLEQFQPLPTAGVDKPAATRRLAGQPLPLSGVPAGSPFRP